MDDCGGTYPKSIVNIDTDYIMDRDKWFCGSLYYTEKKELAYISNLFSKWLEEERNNLENKFENNKKDLIEMKNSLVDISEFEERWF